MDELGLVNRSTSRGIRRHPSKLSRLGLTVRVLYKKDTYLRKMGAKAPGT